jgi:O-antigen/teichoic acid export membrane protein
MGLHASADSRPRASGPPPERRDHACAGGALSVHPRKLVRDSLSTALSQYVARLALLARGLVAAAALGPLGYGSWNALSLLLDYGSYASFGALQGLDLALPPEVARGDRAAAERVMRGTWTVVTLGGALFALAAVLYLAAGGHAIQAPWGMGAPLLMVAAALLQLAIQYHLGVLRAHGAFQTASAAQSVQAVLGGVLGLALVWRFGVWGLLGGWLAGSLVALVVARRGPVRPPLLPGPLAEGAALVRIGFPIFGFFAASLVLRSADRVAFVRYAGTEGLGQYSLGLMAAGLILYLPEAAATVLTPRIAAAARGARDRELTREEVRRAHRALAVALPPLVAVAMVWAGPVIGAVLPAYADGVPPLRLLAIGALLLSGATLPGYYVLASGGAVRLLTVGVIATLMTVALVFTVAARDHRPASIALASAAGYGLFALGLVLLAAPELCASLGQRLAFLATSFVPALWAGGAAWVACGIGDDSLAAAVLRSLAVLIACAPMVAWLGRGAGLKRLAREWLAGRTVPA